MATNYYRNALKLHNFYHVKSKRFYYSHTAIPGLTRKNPWELQMEIPSDAPPVTGYNYPLNRIANIINATVEKRFTKILHVYPESSMIAYFSKDVAHIEAIGLSVYHQQKPFQKSKRYTRIHTINDDQTFPVPNQIFHFTIHALPIFKKKHSTLVNETMIETISPIGCDLKELLRPLNPGGELIVGYPESVWNNQEILEQLVKFTEEERGMFKLYFKVPLCIDDLLEISEEELAETHKQKVISHLSIVSPDKVNDNNPAIMYVIGVFRKAE